MCGIGGRLGPALSDEEATRRLTACDRALAHRGPDASGLFRAGLGDFEIGLVHRRLSIIDLSPGGVQPFASDDGALQVVFNGEIYNYLELKAELEGCGARFRTASDTEVLLRAYERWGEDCLSRLRGMFAFALWDRRREALFCARDRLGIKPFFYALQPDTVAFASEIAPLFGLASLPRDVDLEALDDFLTYLYVPAPRTIYRAIRELPPGHALTVTRRRGLLEAVERRWWSLPTARLEVSFEEAARRVRETLETVVRQHLLSDVPLGAFLSGGLDSTTLVALMSQLGGARVKTFCMTFGADEGLYDERQFARIVADRYDTDHTEIPVNPDISELLPRTVRHFGQPFGNPTSLLVAELSRLTRQHVTVALAGDGGDEIFLGYPRYAGMRLKARYDRVPAPVRSLLARLADRVLVDSQRGRHGLRRAREFLSSGALTRDEAYASWISYFGPEDRQKLFSKDVRGRLAGRRAERWLLDALESTGSSEPADRAAKSDLATFLPGNLLAYGDRMSMLHGLELRVPFCDHVLVELLASLPESVKMPGGQAKGLMRAAMGDLLPAEVRRRGKLGFNPPMAKWLVGPLRPRLEELAANPPDSLRMFFDPAAIRGVADEHLSGRRDRSLQLWSLMVIDAWHNSDRDAALAVAA